MHFVRTAGFCYYFVVHLRVGWGGEGDIAPLIRNIDIRRGEWSDSRSSSKGFELNKSMNVLNSLRKIWRIFKTLVFVPHRTTTPGTSILQPVHDIDRLFRAEDIKFRSKEIMF